MKGRPAIRATGLMDAVFCTKSYRCGTDQTVFHSEGGHMADDLNEFDDPERSYRRGYVHGARELLAALERRLPADQRAIIETWLEGDLSKWRLENLRGKTGRNKTGLRARREISASVW